MQSASKKHDSLISEPLGNKPVTALAGVSEVLGVKLAAKGYSKATNVLGQYLVMNQNKAKFADWMKETCGANSKQASDC